MIKIDFDQLAWTSKLKGARAKVVQAAGKQLRLVEFTRDLVEPDWCGLGHVGYILEGELEIDFGDGVEIYRAGDGFIIPAGRKHMASVPGEVYRLILVEDI